MGLLRRAGGGVTVTLGKWKLFLTCSLSKAAIRILS